MRRTDALAIAAENWPRVRQVLSDFLSALDAALGAAGDPDASEELTPADVTRVEAWVARRRRRLTGQKQRSLSRAASTRGTAPSEAQRRRERGSHEPQK